MARTQSSKVEAHCRALRGATASRPFGPEPLVFKVGGKMFALVGRHDDLPVVSLKCDPERSAILRASFASITPGYHLNKTHWNTIVLDGSVPSPLVIELVDHAYELVRPREARRQHATRGARERARSRRRAR